MNVLKCILVQKVGSLKYKSGLLHGHKMKIAVCVCMSDIRCSDTGEKQCNGALSGDRPVTGYVLCYHAVWEHILCALQRERERESVPGQMCCMLHWNLPDRPKNEVPNIAMCVRPIAWRHRYRVTFRYVGWHRGMFLPFLLFTWFRTARAAARANICSWFEVERKLNTQGTLLCTSVQGW